MPRERVLKLLNERQRNLLCLPINLSVYLEIDDPDLIFNSPNNLFDKLIEKKQRSISVQRRISWPLIKALSAVSTWMSKRQKLSAPVTVLDEYPNAIDILNSEGLIITSKNRLNFFHESFFDHVYARSFINSHESINDLLISTEQHLFRRTQVRQILEALRQNDYERYLVELASVLMESKIRYHIKAAICHWLSAINQPLQPEFDILMKIDNISGDFSLLFRLAVMSSSNWFKLLNKNNWINIQLDSNDEKRIETVLWWLHNIAGEWPIQISLILREWWKKDQKNGERLLDWFGFVKRKEPDDDLFKLCCEVIEAKPKSLFKEGGFTRLEMLFHTWIKEPYKRTSRLLTAIFDAWFYFNPNKNPFEREEIKEFSSSSIFKLSDKSALSFLNGTTDAIVRSVRITIAKGKKSGDWYGFNYRTYSGDRFGFDKFLKVYKDALTEVAKYEPYNAIKFLKKLDPDLHECMMHLHLEVVKTNPVFFNFYLPKLIANKLSFESGYNGAAWLSLALACKEDLPYLYTHNRIRIEEKIRNYNPEIEYAIQLSKEIKESDFENPYRTKERVIHWLNLSKYDQWCILETVGEHLLSPSMVKYLCHLRYKFSHNKVEMPKNNQADFIRSPINRENCVIMKNDQWLSAIQHYSSDENRKTRINFFVGGARELSMELKEASKKEPIRFADLIQDIPSTAHSTYIENILWGLAEAESPPDDSLVNAVVAADLQPEKLFGAAIAKLIESHSHLATNNKVLKILIWYALNGEAEKSNSEEEKNEKKEPITIEKLVSSADNFSNIGRNSVRGRAWLALGSILWDVSDAENEVWEALEIALDTENNESVRCCMMRPLIPLFNMNKERFSKAITKLIRYSDPQYEKSKCRLTPIITNEGIHLFRYIYFSLPDLAYILTTELLSSGDETKELIGAWLLFCESYRRDIYNDEVDKLYLKSDDHKRLLSNVTSSAVKWAENRHRAENFLKSFFFDEDKQVRNNSAKAFRDIPANEAITYRELATEFLQSPAYLENGYHVLQMLREATCDVVELVIIAAEKKLSEISRMGRSAARLGTSMHNLQDLLKREYTASESNPPARAKILDLIDLMISYEIYGVDKIVAAHDRW